MCARSASARARCALRGNSAENKRDDTLIEYDTGGIHGCVHCSARGRVVSWAPPTLSRSPPPTGLPPTDRPPPPPHEYHTVSRKRTADGTVIVQVPCARHVVRRPSSSSFPSERLRVALRVSRKVRPAAGGPEYCTDIILSGVRFFRPRGVLCPPFLGGTSSRRSSGSRCSPSALRASRTRGSRFLFEPPGVF